MMYPQLEEENKNLKYNMVTGNSSEYLHAPDPDLMEPELILTWGLKCVLVLTLVCWSVEVHYVMMMSQCTN